jgi:ketosteroid isomerase-like protein
VSGLEAIREAFAGVFEGFDTSAYEPTVDILDVHGDHGYVLVSFRETLRPRAGGPGVLVSGRNVQFWHRRGEGGWRITMVLTARSAPDEPVD